MSYGSCCKKTRLSKAEHILISVFSFKLCFIFINKYDSVEFNLIKRIIMLVLHHNYDDIVRMYIYFSL